MSIRVNRKVALILIAWILIASLSSIVVNIGYNIDTYEVIGINWAIILLFLIIFNLQKLSISSNIKHTISLGIIVRVVWAIYLHYDWIHGHTLKSDQTQFLITSSALFQSDFTGENYSSPWLQTFVYALRIAYHIVGDGDLAIRMFNIYAWFLGVVLICKISGRIQGWKHQMLIALYTFMPWNLYLGGQVLREPFKQLFLMVSLYYLLKWMDDGKKERILCSCIAAFPAVWLHVGDIAMYPAIIATYYMWDYKNHRWEKIHFSAKQLSLPVAIILGYLGIQLFARTGISTKIPEELTVQSLMQRLSNDSLNEIVQSANTNYLRSTRLNNIFSLIITTIYLMVCFWLTPLPTKGFVYIVFWLVDTLPWWLFLFITSRKRKGKILDERTKVIWILLLFFTLVYGLGTYSGGTAMRHRGHILGLCVMCASLSKRYGLKKSESMS